MKQSIGRGVVVAACAAGLLGVGPPLSAVPLQQAVEERQDVNAAAAESQRRVDQLSEETDELLSEYRRTLQQVGSLDLYIEQIEGLIAAQDGEMASLRAQVEKFTVVGREVMPLMLRMVDALEAFVELDVPFLLAERRDRVRLLRDLLKRPDVTDSEKYRRVLEAYQIENEYGRTIEAYPGEIGEREQARSVDFLRVGRIALLYQTLDGAEAGVWNAHEQGWIPLGDEYRRTIRQGLRIARKQAAPDLVRLPIPTAEVAR